MATFATPKRNPVLAYLVADSINQNAYEVRSLLRACVSLLCVLLLFSRGLARSLAAGALSLSLRCLACCFLQTHIRPLYKHFVESEGQTFSDPFPCDAADWWRLAPGQRELANAQIFVNGFSSVQQIRRNLGQPAILATPAILALRETHGLVVPPELEGADEDAALHAAPDDGREDATADGHKDSVRVPSEGDAASPGSDDDNAWSAFFWQYQARLLDAAKQIHTVPDDTESTPGAIAAQEETLALIERARAVGEDDASLLLHLQQSLHMAEERLAAAEMPSELLSGVVSSDQLEAAVSEFGRCVCLLEDRFSKRTAVSMHLDAALE